MRLHVVFDEQGTIVAANTLMPATTGANAPRFGPVLEKGQREATVDVPEIYAQAGLAKIAQDLRVVTGSGTYALTPK